MAVARIPVMVLSIVRFESADSGGSLGAGSVEPSTVRLSLSKPSWIIKSEVRILRF